MIEFIQKEFTLQEGHYTGPKDQDKLPGAVEIIGKSALGGALAGSAVGAILKDTTALEGAIQGGKYGALAGVILKIFLNYLHKPMSKVKFQEVDRKIRKEFGIYRAAGITVGDSISNRKDVSEKFSFNDRNVTNYKITITVQNNQVTMYTFGLSDKDLEKVDNTLDYYCKKYFGMKYSASLLSQKMNSYAVTIVFTNYQVISNFIMELSNELETKINLMDNDAIVAGRLQDEEGEEDQRNFSVAEFGKNDIIKILSGSGISFIKNLTKGKGLGKSISCALLEILSGSARKLTKDEMVKAGIKAPREAFGNKYLYDTLLKLHYIDGFNFVSGEKNFDNNMSMIEGLFVVTSSKKDDVSKIDKLYWGSGRNKINKSRNGDVIVWTYSIQSRGEFEFLLKKLMSSGIKFNIFE